jgi:hypothetical protein
MYPFIGSVALADANKHSDATIVDGNEPAAAATKAHTIKKKFIHFFRLSRDEM